MEDNLEVGLDLGPLRSLMAGEPGLDGVQVQRVARGVALSGEVASVNTAERAARLAAASLPEGMLVENNLRVALDIGPLRALLAADPDLQGVQVQRLARGVALSGEVGSPAAAERAIGLATASIPEDMLVENNLRWGWTSGRCARSWRASRAGRGAGAAGWPGCGSERRGRLRRHRRAGGAPCDRVSSGRDAGREQLACGPGRRSLARTAGQGPRPSRCARSASGARVALSGEVASVNTAERAVGLAMASIPEDMLVEDNLEVGLDLGPLRLLMAGEPGLDGVQVQRVARGVALSGEVASVDTADRAVRLAAASLPRACSWRATCG